MPSLSQNLQKRQYGYGGYYGNGNGLGYGARVGIVSHFWPESLVEHTAGRR